MGEMIKGVVQAVESKNVAGGKQAWDIVVGGQRYGAGLYKPKANEGDYVQFELDDSRGYKNVGRGSLRVSAGKPPAEAVAEAAATAPVKQADGSVRTQNDAAKEKRELAKQETISRQSALNSAIAFLAVGQAGDALGLPKTDNKGQRLIALETQLAKYTQMFYEQSTSQKWKGDVLAAVVKEESPPHETADSPAEADAAWD